MRKFYEDNSGEGASNWRAEAWPIVDGFPAHGNSDFTPGRCATSDERRFELCGRAMQSMGNNMSHVAGVARNTACRPGGRGPIVSSNAASNRRGVGCRGHIGTPGIRRQTRDARYDRAAAGPACAADDVSEEEMLSYWHGMQHTCNEAEDAVRQWRTQDVDDARAQMLHHIGDRAGTMAYAFLSAAVGTDASCAIHIDAKDSSIGVMISAGYKAAELALPEYEAVVHLEPGDVFSFRPQQIYHGAINHRSRRPSEPEQILISMYNNKDQLAAFLEHESVVDSRARPG